MSLFDATGRISRLSTAARLVQRGFVGIPSSDFSVRVQRTYAHLCEVTKNPALAMLHPWHVVFEDEFGRKYKQEAGLRPVDWLDRDNERKDLFHFLFDPKKPFFRETNPFLAELRYIATEAYGAALMLAEQIDGLYGLDLTALIATGTIIVRVLRYHGDFPIAARQHVDRSAITFHIHSTHPGLVIWNGEQWVTIDECSHSSIGVFLGEKWVAHSRGHLGLGTLHGVRRVEKIEEDRYALIVFVHPTATPGDSRWLRRHRGRIALFEKKHPL